MPSQPLQNPVNGRADALPGIEIPVDQGMSLEHTLEIRNRSRFRSTRMAPEGVQRHFRAGHREAGLGVDGRSHAVDRLALAQGGNPHGGVQHHHAQASVHHLVGLAAFDEMYPVTDAAGRGEGGKEARVVDKTVIQRVIADDDMGIRRGALGKRGQHAGDGFLHAAVGRIAAHLGIGVKLEREEKKRRMGAVRGPKRLNGTLPPDGTAQHAQKPAPDLAAGALRTVGLKTQRKMVPA